MFYYRQRNTWVFTSKMIELLSWRAISYRTELQDKGKANSLKKVSGFLYVQLIRTYTWASFIFQTHSFRLMSVTSALQHLVSSESNSDTSRNTFRKVSILLYAMQMKGFHFVDDTNRCSIGQKITLRCIYNRRRLNSMSVYSLMLQSLAWYYRSLKLTRVRLVE